MTPEGRVKEQVKKILREAGTYWLCPVQNGMGRMGLDFHCIHRGIGFCIETKAPGKKPTPRQNVTMMDIENAGGRCFVIDGTDDTFTYDQLREFLRATNQNT